MLPLWKKFQYYKYRRKQIIIASIERLPFFITEDLTVFINDDLPTLGTPITITPYSLFSERLKRTDLEITFLISGII